MLGDPINCMADGVPGGAMDLFCWIHSTFSVSSRFATKYLEYLFVFADVTLFVVQVRGFR